MSTKVPFKFEEFYEAFGKSVSSDVIFEEGEVHIVSRKKESQTDETSTSPKPADPALVVSEGSVQKHAKGRLLDSADRRRLPWSIRALLEAQEPDGSWLYSSSFEFIINGTAPPPMEGIAGKLWATAIAITVWRQFPEYFELLETNYEKAMLHADENVLRIVRSVLQFDALDQIRPYKNDEARVIREQLAREVAAKRELELDEELKITRMREEEVRIGKLSLAHARRLPMSTQHLFVSELDNELTKVFSALPTPETNSPLAQRPSTFKVGQLVESCRRRRTNGSALSVATTPPRWHLCRVAALDEESRLLQLDFLDGDCEREGRVPMKFVRATAAGAQEIRAAEFEGLKHSWSQPIVYKAEIARLEEARTIKLKPLAWNSRRRLILQERDRARSEEKEGPAQNKAVRPTSNRRPRSSAGRSISRGESKDDLIDIPFQAAAAALIQYDRAYARVQEAAGSGAKRYAAAVLYRERFHAFDELSNAIVALTERTVEALEAIWRWKRGSPSGAAAGSNAMTFIWKGDDFVATQLIVFPHIVCEFCQLVRSLDFLRRYHELAEWYGEEFPLDGNPFMQSSSLLDKAEERGLQPATQEQQQQTASSVLREVLKLHHRSEDGVESSSSLPTWWPEARYSHELLRRIDLAEQTAAMVDKSELVAYEREKRLYKDAYVENFRSVRYFPSLATIGAGRTDGDSIVLVQEPQLPVAAAERSPPKGLRSKFDDVASRLIPPDSLEKMFDTTPPLTTFRSAIMCKHAKARQERRAAEAASGGSSASKTGLAGASSRYETHSSTPGVFKPTSVVEAKGAIQRKVTYDGQPFQDKPRAMRSVMPRADAPPLWANNNPASARREICSRTFFNVPLEGTIKADRKYTQEFVRLSMGASHAGHRDAAGRDSNKGGSP